MNDTPTFPKWPVAASVVVGLVMLLLTTGVGDRPGVHEAFVDGIGNWILRINMVRAPALLWAATYGDGTEPTTPAASRPVHHGLLGPSAWEAPPPPDPAAARAVEERRDRAMRRIAFVEIAAVSWNWAIRISGGLVILLGILGMKAERRRRAAGLAVMWLVFAAAAMTLAGMGCLSRFGDFPPLSVQQYLQVAVVGSAYGWLLLVVHATTRRVR